MSDDGASVRKAYYGPCRAESTGTVTRTGNRNRCRDKE